MLLQTSFCNLSNVFPILCQISQHLQYALLTELIGQFIEVHKSQSLKLFFQQHFEKLEINLTLEEFI